MKKEDIIKQDNYKEIDDNNVKLFNEHGIGDDTIWYTCTICGREVTVDGSASYRGHDLMCCSCVENVFGGYSEALKYLEQNNVKG